MTESIYQYRAATDVLHQPLGDEAVFLNLNNDRYYGVDDVGAHMWQLLVETGDPEQVVQQILVEYDVDETTLRADVDGFVASLLEAGLIERCTE